jgi:hypothetical protein
MTDKEIDFSDVQDFLDAPKDNTPLIKEDIDFSDVQDFVNEGTKPKARLEKEMNQMGMMQGGGAQGVPLSATNERIFNQFMDLALERERLEAQFGGTVDFDTGIGFNAARTISGPITPEGKRNALQKEFPNSQILSDEDDEHALFVKLPTGKIIAANPPGFSSEDVGSFVGLLQTKETGLSVAAGMFPPQRGFMSLLLRAGSSGIASFFGRGEDIDDLSEEGIETLSDELRSEEQISAGVFSAVGEGLMGIGQGALNTLRGRGIFEISTKKAEALEAGTRLGFGRNSKGEITSMFGDIIGKEAEELMMEDLNLSLGQASVPLIRAVESQAGKITGKTAEVLDRRGAKGKLLLEKGLIDVDNIAGTADADLEEIYILAIDDYIQSLNKTSAVFSSKSFKPTTRDRAVQSVTNARERLDFVLRERTNRVYENLRKEAKGVTTLNTKDTTSFVADLGGDVELSSILSNLKEGAVATVQKRRVTDTGILDSTGTPIMSDIVQDVATPITPATGRLKDFINKIEGIIDGDGNIKGSDKTSAFEVIDELIKEANSIAYPPSTGGGFRFDDFDRRALIIRDSLINIIGNVNSVDPRVLQLSKVAKSKAKFRYSILDSAPLLALVRKGEAFPEQFFDQFMVGSNAKNILLLKRVLGEKEWLSFRNAFKTKLLNNPTKIQDVFNSFADETIREEGKATGNRILDALLTKKEQRALSGVAREIKRIDKVRQTDLPAQALAETVLSDRSIRRENITALVNSMGGKDSKQARGMVSGLLNQIQQEATKTTSEGYKVIDFAQINADFTALLESDRFRLIASDSVLQSMDDWRLFSAIAAPKGSGASIQVGATAAKVSGVVQEVTVGSIQHGPQAGLTAAALQAMSIFASYLGDRVIGSLVTNPSIRKVLIGVGKKQTGKQLMTSEMIRKSALTAMLVGDDMEDRGIVESSILNNLNIDADLLSKVNNNFNKLLNERGGIVPSKGKVEFMNTPEGKKSIDTFAEPDNSPVSTPAPSKPKKSFFKSPENRLEIEPRVEEQLQPVSGSTEKVQDDNQGTPEQDEVEPLKLTSDHKALLRSNFKRLRDGDITDKVRANAQARIDKLSQETGLSELALRAASVPLRFKKELIVNPSETEEFDEEFGDGVADFILNGGQ